MKLHPDLPSAQHISGHGPGWIAVDGVRYTSSLVVDSRGQHQPWSCLRYEQLQLSHLLELAAPRPEVLLLGSGLRLRFPPAAWLQTLAAQRIGLETMDTAAACRTYNILAGEGRHVIAALVLETP
jgi:uncharacterized protein